MNKNSLLSRLKPEFRKGLERSKSQYGESVDRLWRILDKETFYTDLSISTVNSIFIFGSVDQSSRGALEWAYGEDVFEPYNHYYNE